MRGLRSLFLMKKRPASPGRRKRLPRWVPRLLVGTAAMAVILGYLAGVAHLTRSGWTGERLADIRTAIDRQIADAGFRVRSIRAHGLSKTETSALREALGVSLGEPILALDLPTLRRRAEALPWVRAATVERTLPDTLIVRVAEREPLALWQHRGAVALIDNTGAVIPGAPLAAFQDLPLITGRGAPRAAVGLLAVLNEAPELAGRVTAASYVEERRWDVIVDDRVTVQLPQFDARRAWLRLAKEERDHGLLERDILAVNIRNSEQWVFRLPPGGRLRMTLQNGDG